MDYILDPLEFVERELMDAFAPFREVGADVCVDCAWGGFTHINAFVYVNGALALSAMFEPSLHLERRVSSVLWAHRLKLIARLNALGSLQNLHHFWAGRFFARLPRGQLPELVS